MVKFMYLHLRDLKKSRGKMCRELSYSPANFGHGALSNLCTYNLYRYWSETYKKRLNIFYTL